MSHTRVGKTSLYRLTISDLSFNLPEIHIATIGVDLKTLHFYKPSRKNNFYIDWLGNASNLQFQWKQYDSNSQVRDYNV